MKILCFFEVSYFVFFGLILDLQLFVANFVDVEY